MAFDFFFSVYLIKFFFTIWIKKKSGRKKKLVVIKIIELFKYKKLNECYWNGLKFYKQIINKVLFIIKALYLNYIYFFSI